MKRDQTLRFRGVHFGSCLVLGARALAATTASGGGEVLTNQTTNYTNAGSQSAQGSNGDVASSATWGGVAATCWVACLGSATGIGASMQSTCSGASMAGAAADVAINKDLNGSFAGMAGASGIGGGSSAASGATGTSGTQQQSKSNKQACVTAATSTAQSIAKGIAAQNQQQAANANNDLAAGLASDGPVTGGAQLQAADSSGASGAQSASASGSDPCAGKPMSSLSGMLRCALHHDPTLPPAVATEAFQSGFEKLTGTSLNQFFGPSGATAQGIAQAAAAGGLSADQVQTMASAIAKLEQGLLKDPSSAYASASGGGHRGGSDGDAAGELNGILAAALGKLLPKTDGAPAGNGVSAIELANRTCSPASLAEDPTISIFERVTYRYHLVSPQFEPKL